MPTTTPKVKMKVFFMSRQTTHSSFSSFIYQNYTKQKTLCPGAHLLSRNRTTIGPRKLNDRVRDGNGCDLPGNSTKTKGSLIVTELGSPAEPDPALPGSKIFRIMIAFD